MPAWQLILELDKRPWVALLAIAIIVYNMLRALLTRSVGLLRDQEERSGYTPAWFDYNWLYRVHHVARVLLFVSAASFLYHAHRWLTVAVYPMNLTP